MTAGTTTITSEQDQIIDEFSQFSDWTDKYEYLIDIGKSLPALDAKFKEDAYLVKGCQSRVWLQADVDGDRLILHADSDTVITKGIIALLIRVLSGQPLAEVEQAELYFIDAIGLKSHLSPTRSNGLISMIQHIKSYAHRLSQNTIHQEGMDVAQQTELMIEKIKEVYDPEIPVDIYELGLIYSLDIDPQGNVKITMTLTSPACPVAGSLPIEVQEKLLSLPFVNDVELALVWEPPWNKERMSDVARMALDMF